MQFPGSNEVGRNNMTTQNYHLAANSLANCLEVFKNAMINETLPGPTTKPLDRTVGGLGQTLDQRDGINDSEAFFNEQTVCDLILKFQCNRDVLPWRKIVEEIMPLVDTIIRNYNFQQYDEIDALRAECATKLSKVLLNYD